MPKHSPAKPPIKPGTNKKAAHRAAFSLERIAGIEPVTPAWEAGVLPLNYIRKMQYPYDTA